MRSVVGYLDAPNPDKLLDAEDAFQDACGYGGRVDGASGYRFTYLTVNGVHRWTIALTEQEIRAISDGLQIEAVGERHDVVRTHHREPTGEPLLIWGAYNDDALRVMRHDDLVTALDTLRMYALDKPRILRMWSTRDDQLIAAVWRDVCAIYIIESLDGYATSTGDPTRTDSFEAFDHDGKPLIVPWSDGVPWPIAGRALLRFAAHGELGPEIALEGRIPSQLLMFGEVDRQGILGMRAEPARDPRDSSLPRLVPTGVPTALESIVDRTQPVVRLALAPADFVAWGRRVIETLSAQGLIELGAGPGLDEVAYQLSGHLQAHGEEAEYVLDIADWLANEIRSSRGVAQLFATGGDLQLALRRTRTPE
ncbi:MAG: hypothetical protein ABIY55_34995 [Kofleriaceae bacterium]